MCVCFCLSWCVWNAARKRIVGDSNIFWMYTAHFLLFHTRYLKMVASSFLCSVIVQILFNNVFFAHCSTCTQAHTRFQRELCDCVECNSSIENTMHRTLCCCCCNNNELNWHLSIFLFPLLRLINFIFSSISN